MPVLIIFVSHNNAVVPKYDMIFHILSRLQVLAFEVK